MNSQDSTINFAPYAQNIFMVIVNIILTSINPSIVTFIDIEFILSIHRFTQIWDKMIDQVRKYDRFNTT